MISNNDKICFLDVDGVINNDKTMSKTPNGFTGVSGTLVDRLKKIIEKTDAKIVLCSSWRVDYLKTNGNDPDSKYLIKQLSYKGLMISDCTCKEGINRGWQVSNYLKDHKIEKFVILDDEYEKDYEEYHLTNHVVHTDTAIGLTDKNVIEAINILEIG